MPLEVVDRTNLYTKLLSLDSGKSKRGSGQVEDNFGVVGKPIATLVIAVH